MSKIVNIRQADDPRDVIHQAVQCLSAGELVALPTETVYVMCANPVAPAAIERLTPLISDTELPQMVLALQSPEQALDYVPKMTKLGRKFVRRSWPGPVTLVFDVGDDEGLTRAFPEASRAAVLTGGAVALRVPAHDVFADVLDLLPAPLMMFGESHSSENMTTASACVERFGDLIAMAVDDGSTRYGETSSIVKICGDQWDIVRPGVVSETTLTRLASEMYLFVCTGNTCRSPMAEGLFRKLLSERLECREDELIDRGFVVASAGLSAVMGAPPSPEGVAILQEKGVDIRSHESQPLTGRLLDQADHIYTMTCGHRDAILAERPDVADRVDVLARDGCDIPDPIGAGMDEYLRCEAEIERNLRAIIADIEVS